MIGGIVLVVLCAALVGSRFWVWRWLFRTPPGPRIERRPSTGPLTTDFRLWEREVASDGRQS